MILFLIIFLIIFFTLMNNQETGFGRQDQEGSAQDFFLYLVVFFSLAFVAFGEGSILFGFIDKFVTDAESRMFPAFNQGMVKFGIAALIIAGPIFFAISRIITKRINEQKISLESKVRKWLTYLVLFFASATIIGDLITLVVNFLSGDYAASFLLKVFAILLIAGGIFGYYFWDMRRTEISSPMNKISAYVAIAVVIVTFISGFFIIDSPAVSRQKNIDQQVVNDLQSVDNSIQSYFSETGKLPQKLDDLGSTKFSIEIQNVKAIEYKVENTDGYSLCADFMRSSLNDIQSQNDPYMKSWKHDGGNFCFKRVALKKTDIPQPAVK
ncbi:MAG TPA: hypothetical protein DEA89_00940 [Candidatus Moranbacteria bacterium]|nr:hypothetical protein [Candidatus Moranbacteria bacterium]HBI50920.1 hypothetical protein [Candidatus Moranbacteria bacterium]HBU10473.1 hypothetical protein [Candidatus Moranbacteria bacterium]HCO99150.1 hypothetical protein [Candidatus Moranbacteria bacterium]